MGETKNEPFQRWCLGRLRRQKKNIKVDPREMVCEE
jgi:hypothetical protein